MSENGQENGMGVGARVGGILVICAICCSIIYGLVWLALASNPETPAGYVGYLVQGALLGKTKFYGMQTGPTSPGRTWLISVINVSVTPYTYSELFEGENSVLSRDNLKISFKVHIVWKISPNHDDVRKFVERYSTLYSDKEADKIVQVAYDNFLKEPLRTFARDEIQRLNGLEIKEKIAPVGEAIFGKVEQLTKDTPFRVISVVVGNVQYPEEVAKAVAEKMATTQVLERKQLEIEIEQKEREIRVVQARGIAESMEIIRGQLTSQYLQHEAIEAQKAMVGSPNNTVVYIPVGNLGVPLVTTVDLPKSEKK